MTQSRDESSPAVQPLGSSRTPRTRVGPLSGIRVADFCWMGVGSCATRVLADYGAEVIKIEDRQRLDNIRRLPFYKGESRNYGEAVSNADPDAGGLHNNYSRNKLGVTINMRTDKGRRLANDLIASSSIVTENFAPGVMERWGIDYEFLRGLVSDVIYARMSGFGHSGPRSHYRSYGPVVQAVSGLSYMGGLPDQPPSGYGFSYMDSMAAAYASAAILLAVLNRGQTGEGCEIDIAATEVGITLLGPTMLDVAVNGRSYPRPDFPLGNRLEHPAVAPHAVLPCRDPDRWMAITVFDDSEWAHLVAAIGAPSWALDERFATNDGRLAAQDEIEQRLSEWTREQDPRAATELLQAAGVRAGTVQNPSELVEADPQIASREGTLVEMDHPIIGPALFEGTAAMATISEPDHWRSAPRLGEDNRYVFGELLNLSSDELDELAAEGVI